MRQVNSGKIFTSFRSGVPYRGRRFASFRRLSTRNRKSICFLRCGQGSWSPEWQCSPIAHASATPPVRPISRESSLSLRQPCSPRHLRCGHARPADSPTHGFFVVVVFCRINQSIPVLDGDIDRIFSHLAAQSPSAKPENRHIETRIQFDRWGRPFAILHT